MTDLSDDSVHMIVDIPTQRILVHKGDKLLREYSVSTAGNGTAVRRSTPSLSAVVRLVKSIRPNWLNSILSVTGF